MPTHRYLRSISWNDGGHSPPQAGFFHPVLRPVPQRFRGDAYTQGRNNCAPTSTSTWRTKQTSFQSFPREKEKTSFFPFSRTFACRSSCVALPTARALPAIHPRPVHRPLLRPSHKQKAGPRHCAANPLTTKSVDFSLKKTHVGTPGLHALASAARTYSLTARIHSYPFSFLLFYKGKEKRKQKQIQQVRIHRSDSLRSSSRCTRLARRASSATIYVAIATRFVQDCVEDLGLLAASMERIPRCSWHIKDHCLGVNKASRISSRFYISFSSANLSPKKFDFSQKI